MLAVNGFIEILYGLIYIRQTRRNAQKFNVMKEKWARIAVGLYCFNAVNLEDNKNCLPVFARWVFACWLTLVDCILNH